MSDEIGKGSSVRIVGGKDDGVTGRVFWEGPNKFGPGRRYGLKDANGTTFWVDEDHVELHGDQPEKKEATGDVFEKGDRVRIVAGDAKGHSGTVFWVGESKFGPGKRFGVRGDDGETYWADQGEAEATDEPAPSGGGGGDDFRDDHYDDIHE